MSDHGAVTEITGDGVSRQVTIPAKFGNAGMWQFIDEDGYALLLSFTLDAETCTISFDQLSLGAGGLDLTPGVLPKGVRIRAVEVRA